MTNMEMEPQDDSGNTAENPDDDQAAWTPFPSLRKLRGRDTFFGISRRQEPEPADKDEPDK